MTDGNNKIVYVPMVADYIHHGHINIIKIARNYGDVVIGLMTDKSAASYKGLPLLSYEQRYQLVESLAGVSRVVPQDQLDYVPAIEQYRPNYFVHGSDWKVGIQKHSRSRVIEAMSKIGGSVIEPDYTPDISSTSIKKSIISTGVSPEYRLSRFRRLLENKKQVRGIDVHNGMTALIAETTSLTIENKLVEYDFFWLSSLTDSTAKGKPDIELVDFTSRLQTINDILDVTTKPIVFDADTGGQIEHFPFLVNTLERLGISACIIEDKKGLKRNSLFGTDVKQQQAGITEFSEKIKAGKKASINNNFMIIARIESLILGQGLDDSIKRAKSYIEAGADGIMIHSRKNSPDEIIEFCNLYQQLPSKPPLVVVPSSFNSIYEEELEQIGVNIVIYANHLLRSAYPAMQKTALSILKNRRSLECDDHIMSIKDVLNLIPGV